MMPFPELPGKFRWWIDRGVDLPREPVLGGFEGRHDLGQRHIAHDAQVNVASFADSPASDRAVNEGQTESVGQRLERFPQNIAYADRLEHQPPQLIEDGAFRVRLEVDLSTANRAL